MVRLSNRELNEAFVEALGDVVEQVDDLDAPVLELRLARPYPALFRVYLFNATNPQGGRVTREHKIQLSVPGQGRNDRGNFDFTDAAVLLAGKVEDQDAFIFWDAYLYRDFAWSGNVQVRTEIMENALATHSIQMQQRRLRRGPETVIVTPTDLVPQALLMRLPAGAPGSLWAQHAPAATPPPLGPTKGGKPYVKPPRGDQQAVPKDRVFKFDPDLLDRGTTAHKDIQDKLAAAVEARGLVPLSPEDGDPDFDVAWVDDDVAYVAEVKSLTAENEEKQLRLGLGQLLSYLYRLDWHVSEVHGVLAVERPPTSPFWADLCATHNVSLTWPEEFPGLWT